MPQKWKLLSTKDVSPSKWFPIESRTYEMPNGKIVDDFTVSTLADAAMIVPLTTEKKVVLIRQFKQGVDDVVLQFPAGRIDETHHSILETAQHELEEETGIKVNNDHIRQFAKMSVASTKYSELVYCFLAENCEFNSTQKLEENEEIEVVTFSFQEMDEKILNGEVWCVQTVAAWFLAKAKFPTYFE